MNDQTEARRPRFSPWRWLLGRAGTGVFLLVVAAIVLGPVLWLRLKPPEWHVVERATMEFLRQEQIMFLVTDRVVTRLDVVLKEGNVVGIDYEHCKGCGICSFECPVDPKAIEMKLETDVDQN